MSNVRPLRGGADDSDVPEGFRLEDAGKYAINREYTRSRDNNQNFITIHLKVPETFAGQLGDIVGKVPGIKTLADFYRSAGVHRAHYHAHKDHNPQMLHSIEQEMWACDIDMMRVEREGLEANILSYKELMQGLVQSSDWLALAHMIKRGLDASATVRHPYSERIMEEAREWERRLPKEYAAHLEMLKNSEPTDMHIYEMQMFTDGV